MKPFSFLIFFSLAFLLTNAQKNSFSVIGYYAGRPTQVDSFEANKLTHIIFSFCHLRGNQLGVMNARDSATIQNLVGLKGKNPDLKVILSIGGWGGCQTCSAVFANKKDRKAFARSVREVCAYFGADGIDLDWEYPAIEGFPNHQFLPEDKEHFTSLIRVLRRKLGKTKEISFAAGGFRQYIDQSVDWKKVTKKVDRVNLMTYDLVGGYDTVTGHHSPLYSTKHQIESTDNAIQLLLKKGVPANKLAIGAAFYARMWEGVSDSLNGLYQQGKFRRGVAFRDFETQLSVDSGFVYHWDEEANAPYLYNSAQKLFVTYDDKRSVRLKTKYVAEHHLNGIMFWELANDAYTDGLLDAIDKVRRKLTQP